MVNEKKNILFTATFSAPFIRTDLSILQQHHNVAEVTSSGTFTFVRFLRALPNCDITFSWFASVYSSVLVLLTKLFGKRSIIILGGVDVARMPDVNYGIWNSRWKSIIVRYGITHADTVLAVDASIKDDAMRLARYDGLNITVVPTGHDPEFWSQGKEKRRSIVLTVATCDTVTRFKIKGIDFLYDVARMLPNQQFVLVGMTDAIRQLTEPPANIEILPYLSREQLLQQYQSAAVYFQPSMREALGSTLCEAMLCECFPVGTNVGGIPTVIGETGSIVPFGNGTDAVKAIQTGCAQGSSPAARQRIVQHFSLRQRETAILKAITETYGV